MPGQHAASATPGQRPFSSTTSTHRASAADPSRSGAKLGYAWLVFALSLGLLLSDYMSRQVLNAVFPLLKAEWGLSDTTLGALGGVVALMVGTLTFPLSVMADRWGRVRSLTLMAVFWSLATLGCALATSVNQMFIARLCVGIGEAAYGSVGIALVLSVFPRHLRASLSAAFIAGGAFGSVLGMGLGGAIAAQFGWRPAFAAMAIFGLVLVALYRLVVTEPRLRAQRERLNEAPIEAEGAHVGFRALLRTLFAGRSIFCAYVGSGLQLLVMGAMLAWLPSFLSRTYGMTTDRAGLTAAGFVLTAGVGMVVCGALTDWFARRDVARKWNMASLYSFLCCVLLVVGFHLPAGPMQLAFIGAGMLLVGGCAGPASAAVANLTPPAIHATAFATLTLANNLIGLAPGPFVTGVLADRIGLAGAMQIVPFAGMLAVVCFEIGRRTYASDLARLGRTG